MAVPTVSVCMITYNHGPMLQQAVQSVLAQEVDFPFELVIGDDCSTDHTAEFLMRIAKLHNDKVRILPRGRRLGMNANFLRTLTECRGEYVAFLDGDDFWTEPRKLAFQVDILQKHPEFAISFHQASILENAQNGALYPNINSTTSSITSINELCNGNFIHTCTCMVRRNALPFPLPEWLRLAYPLDWPLWIMAARSGSAHFTPKEWATYRINPNSISNATQRKQKLEGSSVFYKNLSKAMLKSNPIAARRLALHYIHAQLDLLAPTLGIGRRIARCISLIFKILFWLRDVKFTIHAAKVILNFCIRHFRPAG